MLYPIELLGLTGGSMLAMIDGFVMRSGARDVMYCLEPTRAAILLVSAINSTPPMRHCILHGCYFALLQFA